MMIAPPPVMPPPTGGHSQVRAEAWFQARTNQPPPANPGRSATALLSQSGALIRGDTGAILESTGLLVLPSHAAKYDELRVENISLVYLTCLIRQKRLT